MRLPIIVQLATCGAAIAGIYFNTESGYAYMAAIAVCLTTIFSIALVLQDDREKAFIKSALSNLVRAVQPSEYVREAILTRIRHIASEEGLPINRTTHIGKLLSLEFFRTETSERTALIVVTEQDLAELSLADEQRLSAAISSRILQKWGQDNIDTDWNEIISRIQDIATVVFVEHLGRPVAVKIWADSSRRYVAVGPPNCQNTTPPEQRAQFPEEKLRELLMLPPLYRSHRIASDCEALL